MQIRVWFLLLMIVGGVDRGVAVAATETTPASAVVSSAGAALAAVPAAVRTSNTQVSVLSAEQVVQILDDTVDWYRTLGTQEQNATQPSDLLILYANRQTAAKVVGLSFEIARANAELLSSDAQSSSDAAAAQALSQQQRDLADNRQRIQQAITQGRQALVTSSPKKLEEKTVAEKKLQESQGELAMVDAQKNLLDAMSEFVNESNPQGAGASALKAHIDAIAATLPTADTNVDAPAATAAASAAAPASAPTLSDVKAAPGSYGIWDLASNVFRLWQKTKAIELVDKGTATLASTFRKISAAPLAQLNALSVRSEALTRQAKAADAETLTALRANFDTLAWLFKQTSAIVIPLSKEQVLLQQYRHNLGNWLDAARRQYYDAILALGVRVAVVAAILGLIFALAEVWRRAVVRFAHEGRRRYQLLMVRRVVTWIAVISIIAMSLVTEIGTFATFAGLLTAGVAVAMQSVLVSIVGYFFLIGKYGIRVGDRVQVGSVMGEVIELGLVRMHLMELDPQGSARPTGRVVAFANLIVFQASGGLFKQISGVDIAWHETTLSLPAVSDYNSLKLRLLAAIGSVVDDHRDEFVRQTQEIERTTAAATSGAMAAQVQMHLLDGRMQAVIRYPVPLAHAEEIDERVSQAVLHVLSESN